MLILGLLSGEVVSQPYWPPYEGKAVVRVGSPDRCIHGCFVMPRAACPVCAYEAAPLVVKAARKLDQIVEGLGFTNLDLEHKAQKLIKKASK